MTALNLLAFGAPLGVLVLATMVGALLAPPDLSATRASLRSQWPSRPAATDAPRG